MTAQTLLEYDVPILGPDGTPYHARACGAEREDGLWEGWLEFESPSGARERTERETTQPNWTDLEYWATGISTVFLQGALVRALG